MRRASRVMWLGIAVLALGGCRAETRRPAAARPAPDAEAAPSGADGGAAADAGPPPAATAGEGDAATAQPSPNVWSDHCREPPERVAAREQMGRMAADHERMTAELRALRDEFEAAARVLLAGREPERIAAVAGEFAARAGAVPGWHPVPADLLAVIVQEAMFHHVVCRALAASDAAVCDGADAVEPYGARSCRTTMHVLQAARGFVDKPSLDEFLARAPAAVRARAEWIGRVVLEGDLEACAALVPPGRAHWVHVACIALAAHDASRCATVQEGRKQRTCRALVYAALGPGGAAGDPPDAVAEILRRWVVSPVAPEACDADAAAIVAARLDVTHALEAEPLALPERERSAGMALSP